MKIYPELASHYQSRLKFNLRRIEEALNQFKSGNFLILDFKFSLMAIAQESNLVSLIEIKSLIEAYIKYFQNKTASKAIWKQEEDIYFNKLMVFLKSLSRVVPEEFEGFYEGIKKEFNELKEALQKEDFGDQKKEYKDGLEQSVKNLIEELIKLIPNIKVDFNNKEILSDMERLSKKGISLFEKLKLKEMVLLTSMLENVFKAAKEDKLTWTFGHYDLIIESIGILQEFIGTDLESLKPWLEKKKKTIETLSQIFTHLLANKVVKAPLKEESISPIVEKPFSYDVIFPDQKIAALFFAEIEDLSKQFEENLIAYKAQDKQALSKLMQMAHSLKGVAKIIELNSLIKLSTSLEELFSEVLQERVELEPVDLDILFDALDYLATIGSLTESEFQKWYKSSEPDLELIIKNINTLIIIKFKGEPDNKTLHPISIRKPDVLKETKKREKILRISAKELSDLMGLINESLVESHLFKPFSESLVNLKRKFMAFSDKTLRLLRKQENELPNEFEEAVKNEINLFQQEVNLRAIEIEDLANRNEILSNRLYDEALKIRMRPFMDCLLGFPRFVRQLGKELKKEVKLEIKGGETLVDREILEKLELPLNHLIKNAIDHGIEYPEDRKKAKKPIEGTLLIEALATSGFLTIRFSDDGKGINKIELKNMISEKNHIKSESLDKIEEDELLDYLFISGFTTQKVISEISGRGEGLGIVKEAMANLGGTISISSKEGKGFSIQLEVPLTLSLLQGLIIRIGAEPYALALGKVSQILFKSKSQILNEKDYSFIEDGHKKIKVLNARKILEIQEKDKADSHLLPLVIIGDAENPIGLMVDEILYEKELIIHPLDPRLGKIPNIRSGAILEDGSPLLILDVEEILKSANRLFESDKDKTLDIPEIYEKSEVKKILIVDDSPTVSAVEKRVLVQEGFYVQTAKDVKQGLEAIKKIDFDLVISDFEMPSMNGLNFLRMIKKDPKLKNIPFIIVSYKESREDEVSCLEAGAIKFLQKSSFHDKTLIQEIKTILK